MTIREACDSDVRRMSYLIRENTLNVSENGYSDEQKRIWIKENTPGIIRNKLRDRTIFCSFQGKFLVGTISLFKNEILGLYVSYKRRGQGIGRALLTHLELYARDHGISDLTLTSTPSAEAFYRANGFEVKENVTVWVKGVPFPEKRMIKRL